MVLEEKVSGEQVFGNPLFYYNIATFLYFCVAGVISTFYYPFLTQQVGLNLVQVSRVTSFGAGFSLIVQPLLSHLFSRSKNKKRFIISYLGSLLVLCVLFLLVRQEWIYWFAVVYGCVGVPLIGTYEIYIEKIADHRGFSYAKIRKWGSVGMGCLTLTGGTILSLFSFQGLHLLGIFLLCVCILIIWRKFADVRTADRNKKIRFSENFKNKNVCVLYLMSFLGIGSYVGCDFAFSSYLTQIVGDVNLSNQLFSFSTGMKIFSEFLCFLVIGKFFQNYNVKKTFLMVFVFSGLRFLCISTGIVPIVILGDLLHAIVFPLFLTVIFQYLHLMTQSRLVSGCYGIVSMLMFGFSNFIFPPIFSGIQAEFGYEMIYRVNVGIALVTVLIGGKFLPSTTGKSESDSK